MPALKSSMNPLMFSSSMAVLSGLYLMMSVSFIWMIRIVGMASSFSPRNSTTRRLSSSSVSMTTNWDGIQCI